MPRVALIQQSASEDKQANLARGLAALEEAAAAGAELACFAELAFEPFYPQRPAEGDVRALAEEIPGATSAALCAKAKELELVIVANLYERDGDKAYDTSPVIDADGTLLGKTRMLHITEYESFHEQGYYDPGDTGLPVYDTAAGRVGVAICYDRHYPEVMRGFAVKGAQLVCIPQAGAVGEWPEGLYEAELQVAAFQNGYFTALANRVGDEERLSFAGESFFCGADGRVIARAPAAEDHILIADLDYAELESSHAKQLFMRDRRPELYSDWVD